MQRHREHRSYAFTLIELVAVIIVLAILSGVALPKFFDYSAKAKESACKGALGGVRAAVANFYANAAINGSPAYPSLSEVQSVGSVMQETIPDNPYNGSNSISAATYDASDPPVSGSAGWNYDASSGRFWANSDNVGENEW
ncbi:MAG: type II secretion system protein [Planctomycetes bacterium]|nr:type II secretion system protein [Planctomycetota bacterium]NOG54675.1 type II secretion system protein [Planctomycetota bacterium]